MQVAKVFDRGSIFREINTLRHQINREMIWDREMGKPRDPEKVAKLSALADQEDALERRTGLPYFPHAA